MTSVLVLGGGPDAEREVSLNSAREVAAALRNRFNVVERTIDRVTCDDLRSMPGDVIFPALHGRWGEGGPLQDVLERDARPYVGSRPRPARMAMDKIATIHAAATIGIPTTTTAILDPRDDLSPIDLPLVVKPVHDGSSVGLHICRTPADWSKALAAVRHDVRNHPDRSYMIEPYIHGSELTVGLLDNLPLPIIRIEPASGVYDYDAKYLRDDTRYVIEPHLPPDVEAQVKDWAVRLAHVLGVRHVARVDFMMASEGPHAGLPILLEINTMPGFTTHSLVPMAARASGLDMSSLCARLIDLAIRDAGGS